MISNKPNFIIAGTMKSSTSAANFNLSLHSNVYCVKPYWKKKVNEFYNIDYNELIGGLGNPNTKELDYFNQNLNYEQGLDFYMQYFPLNKQAIGESSPNYFYINETEHKQTATRIKNDLPDAKIIIILRDPINRAFSHWNHLQRPNLSYGTQFKDQTFNNCTEQWGSGTNNLLQRSSYLENLTTYRNVFGVENIHVTTQEAIQADNLGEYNKMFTFLGVDKLDSNPGYKTIHVGEYDTDIDDSSLTWLKTYFKSDVDAIKALYPDLDYSNWNSY
tara:strand:- start:39 stop:860 length:822 start_codon:yes stop_codon:yes gene_type:complete